MWLFKSAVQLQPCRWILACAPDLVEKAILCTIQVANNEVLLTELLFPWAAFLIVQLDLEVLITVKIHVVSISISPLSIVRIPFRHLVWPPRHPLRDLLLAVHQLIEVLIHEMTDVLFASNLIFLLLFAFLFFLGHWDAGHKQQVWAYVIFFDMLESLLLLPFLDMICVNSWRRWLLLLNILGNQSHEGLRRIPITRQKGIDDFKSRFLGRFHQVHDSLCKPNLWRLRFLDFFFLGLLH
jgi:hypothetical protein